MPIINVMEILKKIKNNNNNNNNNNKNNKNNNKNNNNISNNIYTPSISIIDNYDTLCSTPQNLKSNLKKNLNINNQEFITSNILEIDWNTIIDIEIMDFGNSVVCLLVTLSSDNLHFNQVLIKSTPTIAQECYASVLQNILKLPILDLRLLEKNNEFLEMSSNLLDFSKDDQFLNDFIKSEFEKTFFLIMEFRQNGKKFNELNHKEYFSGYKGQEKFKQLGKIIAFDIFCNNFCKTNIAGDDSSIYFSNVICYETPNKNGWYFSLINSNISCLNNSLFTIGYRYHMNSLKLLLFSIFQNPSTESFQIRMMREHLLKKLNIKLPKSSAVYIQKGIAKGIKSIVNYINYPLLENTKDKVKNIVSCENYNIWKKGIDSIHCPFLLDVLNEIEIEISNRREKVYFVKI
ncbi:hypothetical protein ACTFIR_004996 [Dictyostelium discoideum]